MAARDAPVLLLTGGDPGRLTGGSLYNRHLLDVLEAAGARVRVVTAPPAEYPRLAIVDSIAIAAAFPWVAERPQGCAAVALLHMLPSLHAQPAERLRWRRLEMAFLRHVDMVVAASADLAAWTGRLEVPAERVRVIPPGKDGPQPPPAHEAPSPGMRVLCVANWSPVKNIDVLLRACAGLPVDVSLDLVGDTSCDPAYAARVLDLIRQPELSGRVRVHGLVPPEIVGERYRAASVFALASSFEGYATAVAEALWFGLPVVATAAGGIPDLVTSGVEGLLVPAGRTRPLAQALRRLYAAPALRARLAAAARARGRSLPSWEETRNTLRSALTPLVS